MCHPLDLCNIYHSPPHRGPIPQVMERGIGQATSHRVLTKQATGWASCQGRVITATRAWPGRPPSTPAGTPGPQSPWPQHLVQVIHQLQLSPAFILQPCELPPSGTHLLFSWGPGSGGWNSYGGWGAGDHLLLGQPADRGNEAVRSWGHRWQGAPGSGPALPHSLLSPLFLLSLLPLFPPPCLLHPPLLPLQQAGPLLGHLILRLVFILGEGTESGWPSLPSPQAASHSQCLQFCNRSKGI